MRNVLTHECGVAALALGLVGVFATVALAHHWKLESTSPTATFSRDGKVDDQIEPSAIALMGDGHRALLVDGKSSRLHLFDTQTGTIVGDPLGSPRFPAATETSPNWEGLVRDSLGNYYLIGSHYGKDSTERDARSSLIRFRLRPGEPPAIDDASVISWSIARPLEAALRADGLDADRIAERKVAGLAIREVGDRRQLVIGLSKPDDKVRGFLADISNPPPDGAELKLRLAFAFDAAKGTGQGGVAQLTALEYVHDMAGLMVLTASVGTDNAIHGNTVWYVNNIEKRKATQHGTFEPDLKANGVAVLGVKAAGHRTEIKLLITYDRDTHATKTPSRFQTALLVHERD